MFNLTPVCSSNPSSLYRYRYLGWPRNQVSPYAKDKYGGSKYIEGYASPVEFYPRGTIYYKTAAPYRRPSPLEAQQREREDLEKKIYNVQKIITDLEDSFEEGDDYLAGRIRSASAQLQKLQKQLLDLSGDPLNEEEPVEWQRLPPKTQELEKPPTLSRNSSDSGFVSRPNTPESAQSPPLCKNDLLIEQNNLLYEVVVTEITPFKIAVVAPSFGKREVEESILQPLQKEEDLSRYLIRADSDQKQEPGSGEEFQKFSLNGDLLNKFSGQQEQHHQTSENDLVDKFENAQIGESGFFAAQTKLSAPSPQEFYQEEKPLNSSNSSIVSLESSSTQDEHIKTLQDKIKKTIALIAANESSHKDGVGADYGFSRLLTSRLEFLKQEKNVAYRDWKNLLKDAVYIFNIEKIENKILRYTRKISDYGETTGIPKIQQVAQKLQERHREDRQEIFRQIHDIGKLQVNKKENYKLLYKVLWKHAEALKAFYHDYKRSPSLTSSQSRETSRSLTSLPPERTIELEDDPHKGLIDEAHSTKAEVIQLRNEVLKEIQKLIYDENRFFLNREGHHIQRIINIRGPLQLGHEILVQKYHAHIKNQSAWFKKNWFPRIVETYPKYVKERYEELKKQLGAIQVRVGNAREILVAYDKILKYLNLILHNQGGPNGGEEGAQQLVKEYLPTIQKAIQSYISGSTELSYQKLKNTLDVNRRELRQKYRSIKFRNERAF